MRTNLARHLSLLAAILFLEPSAYAHNGPPFPIIVDRQVGPCVLSLWTHPDVGIGTFFVLVGPLKNGVIPKDLKIDIGVQPLTGRLPEARYATQRQIADGQLRFDAAIPFDAQEFWRVNVYVRSSLGTGQATAKVEVTPPGLGRWDLLLYLVPFLMVGFIWFRALRQRAKRTRAPRV
jgi:hypothetical protein